MTKITTFMNEKQQELVELAELEDPSQMQRVVLRTLTTYADSFRNLIHGSGEQISAGKLSGGARIAYIFRESFGRKVMSMDFLEVITDQEIQTTIRLVCGVWTFVINIYRYFLCFFCIENNPKQQLCGSARWTLYSRHQL